MTSVTINLPDDAAAALREKAAAQGLSLEEWFRMMAMQPDAASLDASRKKKKAAERILALQKEVKPDPEGWTVKDYVTYGRR